VTELCTRADAISPCDSLTKSRAPDCVPRRNLPGERKRKSAVCSGAPTEAKSKQYAIAQGCQPSETENIKVWPQRLRFILSGLVSPQLRKYGAVGGLGVPTLPTCRHSADMSALQEAASASKSLEPLNTSDGYCRAGQCRMRSVLDNDGWDRVERFVEELRAIEHWNSDYWRNSDPKPYEMLAFLGREKRRDEILSQLLILIPPLIKKQGNLWIMRKSSRRLGGTICVSEGSSAKPKERLQRKQVCSIS
jgi:hypothetical protein